ncbi:MAG: 3-oxoacid CoA-transferase subunit A [Chloroflexi bacterium]|nr:3-oxoacid CoA-transferase subunit A [Chloroflexota bacterium]
MRNKVYSSFDEAVADIPDGAVIMVPGFGPGMPKNLLAALHRQGAKALTIIANAPGTTADQGAIPLLVADGRVRKLISSFTASAHPSRPSAFSELYEAGKIDAELVPQGTLAERIRAGGAGIPAFYTPVAVGTELAQGKEHRVFNGRTYLLEHALTADYALLRAWKADTFGNLVYVGSARNYNPIMAMAARFCIAEVEEPIVEPGGLDPNQVHTSGIFVRRLVRIPPPPEGIWDEPYNMPT